MMEDPSLRTQVMEALGHVFDPETGLSITRMDIVHHLEIGDQRDVNLVFRPSSPVCPAAYSLANAIKKAVESVDQVDSVRIRVENYTRKDHLETLLNESTGTN
jgi:metal-sulfur cluster biosynthetic enzyme